MPNKKKILTYLSVALSVVLLAGFIVGFFIKKPIEVTMPGTVEDTKGIVDITGSKVYPNDESEVLLTTVLVRDNPNYWEYLWFTKISDDVVINDKIELPPGATQDDLDKANQVQMVNSQDSAWAAALTKLGYDLHYLPVVGSIMEGSAADKSPLEVNDEIIAVGGNSISDRRQVIDELSKFAPGDTVKLKVKRYADKVGSSTVEELEFDAVLGEDPENPGRPLLGIGLINYLVTDLNQLGKENGFEIKFNETDIGGPSAGLALTVEILDLLTEGDLLADKNVAFTGVIDPSGEVGPVGGVPQKAVAVKDRGVDYFIVPDTLEPKDYDEIKRLTGDDLEIIQVGNLDEALAAIDKIGGNSKPIDEYAKAHAGR